MVQVSRSSLRARWALAFCRRAGLAGLELTLIAALTISVFGCGRAVLAPVGKDPRVNDISAATTPAANSHTVKAGETLYSIAFKYGLSFQEIANWNNIPDPYVIYPNQRLRLVSASVTNVDSSSTTDTATQPVAVIETPSDDAPTTTTVKQLEIKSPRVDKKVSAWMWPTKGRLITSFKRSGNKGIDISGELGQIVHAAADGKVVYSGGGLIGYGELIIIKHNKTFLSAYGHNNKLLVKQGDFVESGQRIATMGHSGTDEVKLHFEIRRDGKPIDPIRYLPK